MVNRHLNAIIERFDGKRTSQKNWLIRCPSLNHEDKNPSCLISENHDYPNPSLHCLAGCEWSEVVEGLKSENLWVTYDR